jgi:hypothetical protein
MAPISAAASLLNAGLNFQFGATSNIAVPGIVSAAENSSFVEQGAPVPVRELTATAATLLGPRKFATIVAYTREMLEASQIEAVVGTVLRESVGLALDAALLDASAASAIRPAGLRNGIGATAESANADLHEAMLEDIDAIIEIVAAVAGNNPIVLLAAPSRTRRMKLRLASVSDPGFEIMASAALGANELVAIATNGLVSATDPTPRISVGLQGALVMDTSPAVVVTSGGTPAASTRSLWQTDSIGLRLIFECNWGLRSTLGLGWVEDVIW